MARLDTHMDLLLRLGRLEGAKPHDGDIPKGSVQAVIDDTTLILPIGDVIDIGQERARLEKGIAKTDSEIGRIDKKLGNAGFLSKAPVAVVEEQRSRRADYQTSRAKLLEALARLAALE